MEKAKAEHQQDAATPSFSFLFSFVFIFLRQMMPVSTSAHSPLRLHTRSRKFDLVLAEV